jgi:hypothetical protein
MRLICIRQQDPDYVGFEHRDAGERQQLMSPLIVVHDDASDSAVGGIKDTQGDNLQVIAFDTAKQIVQ